MSKTVISRMDAGAVTDAVIAWAAEYAPEFHALLVRDRDYARGVFRHRPGREQAPQGSGQWADAPTTLLIFFDETFTVCPTAALRKPLLRPTQRRSLAAYRNVYDPAQDKQAWFQTINPLPVAGLLPPR